MARLLQKWWESRRDGSALSRRDRAGCRYEAYVPDKLTERSFLFEGSVAADIADAERAITELDRSAAALRNTEALGRLLLRAESVASSRIEGLEIGPRRLLEAAAARERGEATGDVTAHDVLANIDAMTYALDTIPKAAEITYEKLLETHRRLLAGTRLSHHAGSIRDEQNWIGGSDYNPCNAAFVPPPPEFVEELLVDLCRFCNDDVLPAVAQAAIAHGQFETIHPFVGGNGRIGRVLIQLVLRRRGLTHRIVPPVSLVLATRANDYVRALTETRYHGDATSERAARSVNDWVALFSGACVRAVKDAESFEQRIAAIQAEWRERLGAIRSHSAVHAILDVLPGAPILTARSAAELTQRRIPAIYNAFERLVHAGILRPTGARTRDRTFEAREVIEAFVGLERQLASPVGDTQIERPARRVPRRYTQRRKGTIRTIDSPD